MPVATVHIPHLRRRVALGRKPPHPGLVHLKLTRYLPHFTATPPPDTVDYWSKAKDALGRMYLNDQVGDCVIAGKMHIIGVLSGNDKPPSKQATDGECSSQYQSICGPGDNGCVITDVLDVWKSRGLTVGGQKDTIDGYVQVDNTNKLEVMVALYLFGNLTLGIDLPQAWADGAAPGGTWDVTNTSVVGGHDVAAVGYNATGVQISTWGMVPPVTITWAAFTSKKWITELYVALGPDWYNDDRISPTGLNVDQLRADLAQLGGGVVPDPGPGPTPVPPSPTPTPTPGTFTGTITAFPIQVQNGLIVTGGAPADTVNVPTADLQAAIDAGKQLEADMQNTAFFR